MINDPNDLFEANGININQNDPNDLFQQQYPPQTQQPQQEYNTGVRLPDFLQNNIVGGLGTGLYNDAAGLARIFERGIKGGATLLNNLTGLNKLVGTPNMESTIFPDIANPEKTNLSYDIGKFGGEYGPLIFGGLQAASKIPTLLEKMSPKLSRVLGAGVRPTKTWKNLYNKYNDEYINPIVRKGMERYEGNINKFGNEKFAYFPEFLEATKDVETFGNKATKTYIKKLFENPTIENAAKLKQQLNDEIYKPRKLLDTAGDDRLAAYENLKKELKPSLAKSLSMKNEKAGKEFLDAEEYWATKVHPELTVKSKFEEMAHKTDLLSKAGANRAAETILKEYFKKPENIPVDVAIQAKKIAQQIRNLNTLKAASLITGIGGSGLWGAKQIKNTLLGSNNQ